MTIILFQTHGDTRNSSASSLALRRLSHSDHDKPTGDAIAVSINRNKNTNWWSESSENISQNHINTWRQCLSCLINCFWKSNGRHSWWCAVSINRNKNINWWGERSENISQKPHYINTWRQCLSCLINCFWKSNGRHSWWCAVNIKRNKNINWWSELRKHISKTTLHNHLTSVPQLFDKLFPAASDSNAIYSTLTQWDNWLAHVWRLCEPVCSECVCAFVSNQHGHHSWMSAT